MNEHGRHAMETMKNHDPESFAQIADPETHFSTLGEEIQQAIWDVILQRGEGSIVDIDDFEPAAFEKVMDRFPKPILRFH